jgi:hypothetical protein
MARIAVGYSQATDLKPAYRLPLDRIIHWDGW